jgi:hypothetical protein
MPRSSKRSRPRRPGRPPLGDQAMTAAERQRKRRALVQQYRLRHGRELTPADKLILAEQEIKKLREEINSLHFMLSTEMAEQDRWRKAGGNAVAEAIADMMEHARRTNMPSRWLKFLTQHREQILRAEQAASTGKGSMRPPILRTIMKVLHPDAQPSEAERLEACQVFNNWIDGHKPRRR